MSDLIAQAREISLMAVPFMLAVICHEVAHGLAALWYGDRTAQMAGRLTFNPVRHLDPMGTLVFVMTAFSGFIIGWAKPVPINPRNFRKFKEGMIVVSAAGAAANVALAFLFYLVFVLMRQNVPTPGAFWAPAFEPLFLMTQYGVLINVLLAVFNLLPVPPLDGSKIVAQFLPPKMAWQYMRIERWGLLIIILLAVTGALRYVLEPVLHLVFRILS